MIPYVGMRSIEALEENTCACHGKQDPAQPYHSIYEHLTLLDIMERHIPHGEPLQSHPSRSWSPVSGVQKRRWHAVGDRQCCRKTHC
ncbi:hypothetical protein CY34DRAFT_550087 [Suillus luteus UH-Slu-Lm8-n1]|uniref:Uncharacterized protein n=1 Tax=Suillus luteus UH-Slu-Lm8-n1 TaxID=930992 RepID=A0A0D0ANR7_9AGAM|nr:hypothetical protein CY34DRAFT_550087 [Suillus luteus UH-Slu-Lm8-n1]